MQIQPANEVPPHPGQNGRLIKFTSNKCSRGREEKGTLLLCWWEYKLVAATMENSLELPQKLKLE